MTAHRSVRQLVQLALIGVLFLAIVVFWMIVTQENGSKNLDSVKITWEEVIALQPQDKK
jgi:ABC-type transporter Mla subunit MlaD